jgi:hypothetical protein
VADNCFDRCGRRISRNLAGVLARRGLHGRLDNVDYRGDNFTSALSFDRQQDGNKYNGYLIGEKQEGCKLFAAFLFSVN